MRVYVCTDHDHHYPVGVASVVIAETENQARDLLDVQLRAHGLQPHAEEPYTLEPLDLSQAQAVVLRDGNY